MDARRSCLLIGFLACWTADAHGDGHCNNSSCLHAAQAASHVVQHAACCACVRMRTCALQPAMLVGCELGRVGGGGGLRRVLRGCA